jgi:hypothetical protein
LLTSRKESNSSGLKAGAIIRHAASSVHTLKLTSVFVPKVWVIGNIGCIAPLQDASVSRKQTRLRCMPVQTPVLPKRPSRKIPRDIHEHVARSFAGIEGFEQSRRERKKIEMRYGRCGAFASSHGARIQTSRSWLAGSSHRIC